MTLRKYLTLLALLTLFTATAQAQQASLLGGRVGAMDPPALASFYKNVFGMQQVDEFKFDNGGIEVMLNFGSTETAAKANTGTQVVLFPRPSDDVEDTIPHLIFNVPDIHAAMTAVTASGGSMVTPQPIAVGEGNEQIMIAIAKDPAGNQLEMIQQP